MNLEHPKNLPVDAFFDQQPQPAFWMVPVLDTSSRITDFEYRYCNQEFYTYTGLTPEGVLGNFVSVSPVIADPNARKKLFQELLNVFETGERMQAWLFNPSLNKYYSYTRNRIAGGVLTVLQDRTEEHKMTQQLENQKHLMDNILTHSSNGISVGEMIKDESGKIVDVRTILANKAAIGFTGIPEEKYLTKTASELDPSFIRSAYFKQCVQCMETGEPFLTQYYLQSIGRWLEVSVSRMDNEHQIYIFTDVTSAKQVQLKLERTASQLQTIINRTQSGIVSLAPIQGEQGEIVDFRFVLVNKTLAAYIHQKPEDLIGEPGSKWFTAYLTNGLFDLFRDTYLNKKVNRFDYHYNADGIDAWIDMMCTRFDHEVLVTFTDYTPVKKLQLQLEQKVDELKRSNKSLEEFAYASSHDLKEPIRKINVFASRLKQLLVTRGEKEEIFFVDRIENAAQRMDLLVDDLLTLSQVSQGGGTKERIDLGAKLRRVAEDLELVIQEKAATIEIGPLPTIHGYRRQIQQLFQNLLSNALKYSKPDTAPVITITSRLINRHEAEVPLPASAALAQYHLIEVQDNGIGFAPENTEKIFQLFQRLHGKTEYEGTGIGLSIARKVAENHQGYIWAESEEGKGAKFKVLLPAE